MFHNFHECLLHYVITEDLPPSIHGCFSGGLVENICVFLFHGSRLVEETDEVESLALNRCHEELSSYSPQKQQKTNEKH